MVSTLQNSGRFRSTLHALTHAHGLLGAEESVTGVRVVSPAEFVEGHARPTPRESPQSETDSGFARVNCVWDDFLAKKEAWRRAVGVVCILLQTDMLIITDAEHPLDSDLTCN